MDNADNNPSPKDPSPEQPLTHAPDNATEEEVLQFLETGNEDPNEPVEIEERPPPCPDDPEVERLKGLVRVATRPA